QQSSYDVVALQLANDMADRMRANRAQLDPSAFVDLDTRLGIPQISDANNLYKTACTGASAVCQPVSIAFDIAEWARRVTSSLPGGRAVICRDTNTFSLVSGYTWSCNAAAGGTGSASDAPVVIKMGWVSRFNDSTDTGTPDGNAADGTAKVQIVVVVS